MRVLRDKLAAFVGRVADVLDARNLGEVIETLENRITWMQAYQDALYKRHKEACEELHKLREQPRAEACDEVARAFLASKLARAEAQLNTYREGWRLAKSENRAFQQVDRYAKKAAKANACAERVRAECRALQDKVYRERARHGETARKLAELEEEMKLTRAAFLQARERFA